ncbi:hemolysin family protein [Sphingoaurantiacus capsulatus]|uniref:Hemolysin family protein n=1 Tax=Sphingoaurantiacus capsulatus TaxID=1771310 RepID=A0ABV7XAI3_9SPHN
MHPFPWLDVAIIFALIALNGFFAMSELAIVSARKPRLQALEKAKNRGATVALRLQSDPGRFLSSVQIGITLVGIVNGAYSGATLSDPIAQRLEWLGLDAENSADVGFAIVIALTTYFSLIVGELIPKQFALRNPEPIAAMVAPVMSAVAWIGAPLVWLLDQSIGLVFRLLGLQRESESQVTAEELHLVVAEATSAGVIEESERAMISGVMRLADRPIRAVMTPRGEVDWLDADTPEALVRERLVATPHSRVPIAEGTVDKIIGVVQARDVLAALLEGKPLDLRALTRSVAVVPDLMDAMDALAALRDAEVPMALVHDEYGHFEGVVTPADLLAAIAGAFRSDVDVGSDPPAVEREDGSWLLSGSMQADEMGERLGIDFDDDRDFHTVAGFVLDQLRHLPETGETFTAGQWRFEVVDMDGRKVDKVIATCLPRPATEGDL